MTTPISRAATLALVLLTALSLTTVTATSAGADTGDGWIPCNTGEICLYDDAIGDDQDTRQFYWSDPNWVNDEFWGNGKMVNDQADRVWNRDTQCTVYLFKHVDYSMQIWRVLKDDTTTHPNMAPSSSHRRCYSG